MSTLALYFGIGLCILILLDLIPGVRHLMAPLIKGAMSLLGIFFGSAAGWLAWTVKTLFQDHLTLLRNLSSSRAQIDPSEAMHDEQH